MQGSPFTEIPSCRFSSSYQDLPYFFSLSTFFFAVIFYSKIQACCFTLTYSTHISKYVDIFFHNDSAILTPNKINCNNLNIQFLFRFPQLSQKSVFLHCLLKSGAKREPHITYLNVRVL